MSIDTSQETLRLGDASPTQGPRPRARNSAILQTTVGRFGLIAVWILMAAVYAVVEPTKFLTLGTFQSIFGSQSPLVFVCMAGVATFIVGEFDLSVASILGVSATVLSVLSVNLHVNEIVAVICALAAGGICGAVNGFVIVELQIDPIVVTLGMSVLLLGVAELISGLATVTGLSQSLADFASTQIFQLPTSFYYGAILAIVFAIFLAFTPLGRRMSFVGANREVARLSGIRVQRIRFGAYVFSGLSSAAGGVLLAAQIGGFDSTTSSSYLLPALAAVFLGTAVVAPGRFNPIGTLITIYFLVTGIVGLQLMGLASWVSNVFYGAALIIAITISTVARRGLLRGR